MVVTTNRIKVEEVVDLNWLFKFLKNITQFGIETTLLKKSIKCFVITWLKSGHFSKVQTITFFIYYIMYSM
jgi:hypothetical protein